MLNPPLSSVPAPEHANSEGSSEWAEIRDANGFFLFELSLVDDVIRIKNRGLTTIVDIRAEKSQRLRELLNRKCLPLSHNAS
ncbi:MAG TPA: hypothetical protein VGB45_02675 [Abditibacterium sp.]